MRDNPDLPALLDAMTLDEQIALLSGADFWTTAAIPRLGIPAVKLTDGPNGARGGGFHGGAKTACFPAAVSLGATWNPALVEQAGRALAQEARDKGARVLLAPTINLHRTPLNGRHFECPSEDPLLTGEIASACVRGVQAGGVAATVKHFVCNDAEFERMTISSEVDARTLRELYLLPFEMAVREAGAMAVMTAYNRVNGVFAGDHAALVRDVLRGEWGFDGLVMSDWFAALDTVASIEAGTDLEMPGPARARGEALKQAVAEGRVDAALVRAAAARVLRFVQRVGGFDDADAGRRPDDERAEDRPETRALIRQLGADGCVLLKNDGDLLPLPATLKRIALIGPNAEVARIMGGGSATVNAWRQVTPRDGVAARWPQAALATAPGADNHCWLPVVQGPMQVEFFASPDFAGPVVLRREYPTSEQFWVGSVEPGLDPEAFSARATLAFSVDTDGEHAMSLISAGRCRAALDGEPLIDNWTDWAPGETYFLSGSAERLVRRPLQAGRRYTVTLEFSSAVPGGNGLKAIRFGLHKLRGEPELAAAEAAARESEVALVFVGLCAEWDSESTDRPDLRLPHGQDALVRRVVAANPRTVVVLQSGGPLDLPWLDAVPAVLQAWYPGQECGHAIADVLSGAVEPGGRLPHTWPKRLVDAAPHAGADPRRYPGVNGRVHYDEGLFVGYRHHDRHGIEPLFAFGHGLGYTQFELGPLQLDRTHFGAGDTVEARIEVHNTGARAGQAVLQFYVADAEAGVPRPPQELKGFVKLALAPGERRMARCRLGPRAFAWFDDGRSAWVAEAGVFEVRAGWSSRARPQRALLTLSEAIVLPC